MLSFGDLFCKTFLRALQLCPSLQWWWPAHICQYIFIVATMLRNGDYADALKDILISPYVIVRRSKYQIINCDYADWQMGVSVAIINLKVLNLVFSLCDVEINIVFFYNVFILISLAHKAHTLAGDSVTAVSQAYSMRSVMEIKTLLL